MTETTPIHFSRRDPAWALPRFKPLAEYQNRVRILTQNVKQKEEEMSATIKQTEALGRENNELRTKLEELETVCHHKEDTIRSLKDHIQKMDATNSKLRAINKQNKRKLNEQDVQLRSIRMKPKRKIKEIVRLQNMVNHKTFQLSHLQSEGVEYRAIIKDLEDELQSHSDESSTFHHKMSALNQRNNDLRRKLETVTQHNRTLKERVNEIESECKEWKRKYEAEKEEIQRMEKEIDGYEMRAKIFSAMMQAVDAEVAKVGEDDASLGRSE